MAETITKDIGIRDLIDKHPEAAKLFAAYGIGCVGCALANFETVEQGLSAHGINVDDFMNDLNSMVNQ